MQSTMESHNVIQGPEELNPVPNYSFGKYLMQKIKTHGYRIAQVDAAMGKMISFRDVLERSISVATNLKARGIGPGDVVGILSGNSLEFCLPVLATLYLGATCAPLNPAYSAKELAHALNISRPSIIFCIESAVQKLNEIKNEAKFLKHIIVFGESVPSKYIPFDSFVQGRSDSFDVVEVDPNTAVASIMCSSGTTGLPKGVMLTHKNFLVTVGHMRDFRFGNMKPSDIHLALLPMFHAYAFVTLTCTLAIGVKSIVMPSFEPHLFLSSIQTHKVTLMMLVPPILVFLGKHPMVSSYNLSSVKDIWCGAAPLSKDVQTQVTKRLGIYDIRQGYGLTETTLALLMTPTGRIKYGSSGVLIPNTICKVVDLETGRPLGPNKNGELCFKGPTIMKGYCGNRTATSAIIDNDGYLHTGDIGYYDNDGYFFIVDRLKELIKYKGYQVPPAELEAILLLHSSIQDAAVIGIPDETAGELPMAFVVRQPGANITADEVAQFVSDHVSPQKRLRGGVKFIASIPKTASGKILRRHLLNTVKSKL